MPVEANGSELKVALAEPLSPSVIDELGYVTGREVQVVVANPDDIEAAVNRYYGEENGDVSDVLQELGVVSLLLEAGVLMGVVLLALQRWPLPVGSLTL